MIAAHAVLVLEMPDHRLYGRASPEGALDRTREPPLLAGDVDLEALLLGGMVALVAGIGDDPLQLRPDGLLDLGDDGLFIYPYLIMACTSMLPPLRLDT